MKIKKDLKFALARYVLLVTTKDPQPTEPPRASAQAPGAVRYSLKPLFDVLSLSFISFHSGCTV